MDDDSLSTAMSTPDDAAFRSLALRLLATFHPQFGGNVPEDNVQLVAGQIAPAFPAEIPVPPGSQVRGSFLTNQQVTVLLDCDLPLERLADFYSEHLPAAGWIRSEFRPGLRAGFVSPLNMAPQAQRVQVGHIHAPSGRFGSWHVEYRRGESGPTLHITGTVREADSENAGAAADGEGTRRTGKGPADVRLTVLQVDPTHRAHERMREQPMPEHLPVLTPLPGSSQQEGGGGYSPGGHFSSTATLFAPGYDVAAVGHHYNEQLARVGWIPGSEGTSPPATWSTWTLTDREGVPWWASFFAFQLPLASERYELHFRAESVGQGARAGQMGSFGMGFSSISVTASDENPPASS